MNVLLCVNMLDYSMGGVSTHILDLCKQYSQMNEVNMAIANWIKENGYEFAGPMFNIYYASPATTQNEDEFVTEVCYPIK